jgi:hypothetical protein
MEGGGEEDGDIVEEGAVRKVQPTDGRVVPLAVVCVIFFVRL